MSQHHDLIREVNPRHKCQTNTDLTHKDYGIIDVCRALCWHLHVTELNWQQLYCWRHIYFGHWYDLL